MTPRARMPHPRRSWAYICDQAANIALILSPIAMQQGVVPHGWWGFAVFGILGLIGGMKMTEARRHWSNSERIARGLDPVPPPLYDPPPLPPPPEDGAPTEIMQTSGSGRGRSGRTS